MGGKIRKKKREIRNGYYARRKKQDVRCYSGAKNR